MSKEAEEFQFKAETQRVLSLVINSLYTNTEVFLRELISNASDALDKARYLQLTEKDAVLDQEGEPGIRITLDGEKKTLTIEDNGVGMTKEEVIENLGTIARSGTDAFVQQFKELTKEQKRDEALELIGQFGVGFYSVFMVAKRVDVDTRSMRKDAEPVHWRSSGEGSYTLLDGERDKPGTRITLHLKEDAVEFSTKWRVEGIVKKYSDFVMFPIRIDDEVINQSSALWRSPKSQVTDEQHAEFFKHITQGRYGEEPLAVVHYTVDAPVQFAALLYIPKKAPLDVFMFQKERPGLRLYAKRVLIMENCETILPAYLRFVRGVVDSEDLTLNVSRETLQENRTVKTIEAQITKQVIKELARLQEDEPDKYQDFWAQFGPVLKEGLSMDFKNKDSLTELCLFHSVAHDETPITLKQYVEAKQDDQDKIYYITGQDRAHLDKSPHLEVFRKKGIDVLLLTDPIDEWVVQALPQYEGLKLESVVHGQLELDEDEERSDEEKDQLEKTVEAVAKVLGDRVLEVRLSKRLTETASCLVSREGDPGANMERIMRVLDDRTTERKRILEINPSHAVVKNLARQVAKDPTSPNVELWSELLLDQAMLSEGVVEDPASLVKRIQRLLVDSTSAAVEG